MTVVNAEKCKEELFRFIANSAKIKSLLELIFELSRKGYEIHKTKDLSNGEVKYLEKKGFSISEKEGEYVISWL